jgi:acetyl-CoA carboxylase biotin carboxyl carrier protein
VRVEEIERLVRLVAETGVAEVEISIGGVHVRIARHAPPSGVTRPEVHVVPVAPAWGPSWQAAPAHVATQAGAHLAAGAVAPGGSAATSATSRDEEEGLHVITASMVGTFYRRPHPEAQPFVKEGDVIKKGQVICVLEAMKIMNEIESDASGTVVKVFVEDGQPVEYGEKLMALRPV